MLGDKEVEMTSVQFVVHPLPGTQEQLAEKLKSVADRLNKYGHQGENSLDVSCSPSVVSYRFLRCVCCVRHQGRGQADRR